MLAGRIDPERLARALSTRRIRSDVQVFDELGGTNAHVLALGDALVDGAVYVAEYQTQGRGRQGRAWACPRGAGILCTVGLRAGVGDLESGLLSLVVPIALCDGILAATRVRCAIDWPNDLTAGGRKLAGVLIDAQATGRELRYAIGFGINCLQHAGHFPEPIRDRATSLDLVSDAAIDRTAVLAAPCSTSSTASWRRRDTGIVRPSAPHGGNAPADWVAACGCNTMAGRSPATWWTSIPPRPSSSNSTRAGVVCSTRPAHPSNGRDSRIPNGPAMNSRVMQEWFGRPCRSSP
jgi:biotin-[acetyl-CoA-carboxylase] ligase BirA-like protein